jgi:magnesium transporter
VLVAFVVLAWRRDLMGALVIGGAISASIVMACLLGVLLPTLVRAFKADPRIAAGPLRSRHLMSYLWLGSVVMGG